VKLFLADIGKSYRLFFRNQF